MGIFGQDKSEDDKKNRAFSHGSSGAAADSTVEGHAKLAGKGKLAVTKDDKPVDDLSAKHIILATGKDDPHRQNNEHMSGALWSKNIWHAMRFWDGWSHDWPYWRSMIRAYIGGND